MEWNITRIAGSVDKIQSFIQLYNVLKVCSKRIITGEKEREIGMRKRNIPAFLNGTKYWAKMFRQLSMTAWIKHLKFLLLYPRHE